MTPLEVLLRRDRAVVLTALAIVIALAWAYVLAGAGTGMTAWDMSSFKLALGPGHAGHTGGAMTDTSGGTMSQLPMAAMATPAAWTLSYAAVMVVMWWVMMVAMMLPSAAPMILLFAATDRRQREKGGPAPLRAGIFASGYVVAWGGFSVAATVLQWAFEWAGILSPMMMNTTSLLFAGGLLVAAGLYQLTPLKEACLRHCRSPIQFVAGHWRAGQWGAFRMGIEHGTFCLGCCWGLMALLFFGGIMNLYWIAGLAVLVAIEKLVPAGNWIAKAIGGVIVLWGATFLYGAVA